MSKKPPLSPILKTMRDKLHGNVRGMHDELKRLDTFIAAKNLITNNRPVAQALVDAFEEARPEVHSEEQRHLTSYLTIDAARTIFAEKQPWLATAGKVRLGPNTPDHELATVVTKWLDARDQGMMLTLTIGEPEPVLKQLAPWDIFVGPEALKTLLQGGVFETTRSGKPVNVQLTKGALQTVDSLVGSTYGEEDVAEGKVIGTIAPEPIPAPILEAQRVEAIQHMQEARGQGPQEERPAPVDEFPVETPEEEEAREIAFLESTEPKDDEDEDPVDDVNYEVQALPAEEALAEPEPNKPNKPKIVATQTEDEEGRVDFDFSVEQPKPKPVGRLVPRSVPTSSEEQAKVEDKILTIIHTVRARTKSDDVMFSRAVLAEKVGVSELKVMAALSRLDARDVVALNQGAPKGDVSLTFKGKTGA